jgi:hypothetical protein
MTSTRRVRSGAGDDSGGAAAPEAVVLAELADALGQARQGRFDVRLTRRDGAGAEAVEQFNEMLAILERRNRDLLRISRVVGREGRTADRLDEESYDGDWATGLRAVNALIDDLAEPTAEIARVIEAVAEGDLSQHMALEIEGRPAARRVPPDRADREHDGRPAVVVRRRGHPGGPRGGHRGRAGRPGRRARGVGHLAGDDRLGQHDGQQPDQPGALDLVGGHRDRPRRPVPHDHR